MSTKKTGRYLAIGSALAAAAIPLSTGTGSAAAGFTVIIDSATSDQYGCELSGESCRISVVNLTDWSTPIAVSADGAPIGTITLPVMCCPGIQGTVWTPQKAGHYTLTATQGTQTASRTSTSSTPTPCRAS